MESDRRNYRFGHLRVVLARAIPLLALGCAPGIPQGLSFEHQQLDLGVKMAGENITVRFPFQVGQQAVTIDGLRPSCGCLNPRVEIGADHRQALGVELSAGVFASVVAEFATAGFTGHKSVEIEVSGSGPGLPTTLKVSAELQPWFMLMPELMKLGPLDPEKAHQRKLEVVGREPFKLTRVLGLAPGCELEGVPSGDASTRHELLLKFPAGMVEGQNTMYLKVFADNELSFIVPVSWEFGGDVWVRPPRILPLGAMTVGVPVQTTVDIGCVRGTLKTPKWRIEGISGVEADCLTLGEPNTYRLRLSLPGDFPVGPIHGDLVLILDHEVEGKLTQLERRIKLVGLVRPDQSSQPRR